MIRTTKLSISTLLLSILLSSCQDSVRSPRPSSIIPPQDYKDTSSLVSTELLLGHVEPSQDSDFVAIPTSMADRTGMYLRSEALAAFKDMRTAAAEDGHTLVIRSATRPFHHQKRIWEDKWHGRRLVDGIRLDTTAYTPYEKARAILRWSSMPGTSRHHWGTDIDINAFENSYFESGDGLALYEWMQLHAADYGYCQVYTSKTDGRTGYEEEKWHWSYRPIADRYTETIARTMESNMITGFQGSDLADTLRVIPDYMLGIDRGCNP